MSITEVLMASGTWGVKLRSDTPQDILDKIGFFSHIAVTEVPEDIRLSGDAVLTSARYVGVVRGRKASGDGTELSGAGMAIWLGDEDSKGAVFEDPLVFTGSTFTNAVTTMLAGAAIMPGTLHSVTGSYTNTHQWVTPRQALDYLTSTMGAEWRVNGDGTLDAGEVTDLYPSEVRAGIFAKAKGTSQQVVGLTGRAELSTDVEDFTTRTVLVAQGEGSSVATGSADLAVVPYLDIHGNPVNMTRLISESGTSQASAEVRAQLQLNRFVNPRDAVRLNTTTHDVDGTLAVGESIWVYDPEAGLVDYSNEIQWQGETIHPVLLRVLALTFPVAEGRGVYLRTQTGEWLDLTPFVTTESGQTNVTVGGYSRSLTTSGSESMQQRIPTILPNTTIPAAPGMVTPFRVSVYQSPVSGVERAQVEIDWTTPLNTDGTTILDGDFYEVRYRTTSQAIYAATHQQLALYQHNELGTHENPIPFEVGAWAYIRAPWDVTTYLLGELAVGTPYEIQVRAIDNGTPPNPSDWSASVVIQTPFDNIAPSSPAPPFVAGSTLAVQVMHRLGASTGGEYNLELDLHHLEVHAEYEPNFEPRLAAPQDGGTLIGWLHATDAEIRGGIPVVGTFPVDNTSGNVYVKVVAVDRAGNRSRPSLAVQQAVVLVDSAHISDLTASKITAGTISTQILNGGVIQTNGTGIGANIGFDGLGFFGINAAGQEFFTVDDAGVDILGHIQAGVSKTGRRIELEPTFPAIRFWFDESNQRYVIQPYTVNGVDDPADAPGIQLYGRNEDGLYEGARMVLWEDGAQIKLINAGATTDSRTGGWITLQRNGAFMGFEDTLNPGTGFNVFAGITSFDLYSRAAGNAGGRVHGTATTQTNSVRDSTGLVLSSVRIADRTVLIKPNGDRASHGYLDVVGNGFVNSSAMLKMINGYGNGTLLKTWENVGVSVNVECRRWDDAVWATFVCDVVVQASDRKTKKDIRDAEKNGRAKIKSLKPRVYRRTKKLLPPTKPSDWALDENDQPTDKLTAEGYQRLLDGAVDGPEELGLVADEVPVEWQVETSDGLGINLYAVVTALVQANQEQDEEIVSLRSEVDTLKTQMADAMKAIEKLTKGIKP